MDTVLIILSQPFVWGLGLGLLIAGFGWKSAWTAKSALRSEIRRLNTEKSRLQEHLNTHLTLTGDGQKKLQDELAVAREQCENLRGTVVTLQQKPGRPENRQWQIQERAVSHLREHAPGFAAAWEQSVRAAATEMEATENGIGKWIQKVLPGSSVVSGGLSSQQTMEKVNLIPEKTDP